MKTYDPNLVCNYPSATGCCAEMTEMPEGWADYVKRADAESRIADLEAKLREAEELAVSLRDLKDGAYLERNRVVAALAKCFPSGIARTAIEGWSDDWHGCVYIDLPTGQVSWHFNDAQADLFAGLPPYGGSWDGHDTDEKYRRLAALREAKEASERG